MQLIGAATNKALHRVYGFRPDPKPKAEACRKQMTLLSEHVPFPSQAQCIQNPTS